MTTPIYKGEAILRARGENDKGRWVRIEIEDDGGVHPFKGLEGERFAVVIVGPLASTDHGQDASESEDVYRRASNSIAPVVGVEPGGDSVPSIAAPPGKQRDPLAWNAEPYPIQPRKKQRWEDLRPSARAAMLTKDADFQRFIVHSNYAEHATESAADNVLKTLCGVLSKSELDSQETSAKRLRSVEVNFYAWRQADQHGQLER